MELNDLKNALNVLNELGLGNTDAAKDLTSKIEKIEADEKAAREKAEAEALAARKKQEEQIVASQLLYIINASKSGLENFHKAVNEITLQTEQQKRLAQFQLNNVDEWNKVIAILGDKIIITTSLEKTLKEIVDKLIDQLGYADRWEVRHFVKKFVRKNEYGGYSNLSINASFWKLTSKPSGYKTDSRNGYRVFVKADPLPQALAA